MAGGADDGLRTAADADPSLQAGFGGGVDALGVEGRAGGAAPGDCAFAPEGGKEVELFLEQGFVVVERVTKEGEGFDEGATAEDGFGAAVGDGIERGKALVDADRVVGAEDGDSGAEADVAGLAGDGGQDDLRGGDGEVRAMMLADGENVDAGLVGQDALGHDVAQDLGLVERRAVGGSGDVAEGVEAEFDHCG